MKNDKYYKLLLEFTMNGLKKYIAESVKVYHYTIKIAGDADKNFLDLFSHNLKEKFDAIELSEPTRTPIQKDPFGFPHLKNESIHIIKGKFRYPATEPMIQQMAQLLGCNVNMVRVVSTNFNDSMNAESEKFENQVEESPLLTHEEMLDNGKEASKEYSNSYLESIKEQTKESKIDIPYEGTKTPSAFDPFKVVPTDPAGKNSPMSKITRPDKPKTGAMV